MGNYIVQGNYWTKEQEYLLSKYYDDNTVDLPNMLDKSINSIRAKIKRMGLVKLSPINKLNNDISIKYPELEFITFNGVRNNSTIKNKVCGHTWEVRPSYIRDRGIGIKCPTCNKTNRKKTTEQVLQEIISLGYTTITSIGEYTGSKNYINITYACGHSDSTICSDLLLKGTKSICRQCTPQSYGGKSHEVFEEEVSIIAPHLTLLEEYAGDNNYIKVSSSKCYHTWKINPHNFLAKSTLINCPICEPKFKESLSTSAGEIELYEWIKSVYSGWVVHSDRSILEGAELDIVVPDKGFAIEYNGEYWHSTEYKDKYYHYNKTKNTRDNIDYQLIHIFEYQWKTKKDIVKSRIINLLGLSNVIYARKCIIKEISFPREFLNANHIQGAGSQTKYNYGLYYADTLVAIMTFSAARFGNSANYELVRYCSILNSTVVGGASKLFTYFKKLNPNKSICSYSDANWGIGNLYKKLGFTKTNSEISYFYSNGISSPINRFSVQKHKLKDKFPQFYDDNKTEAEIMKLAGYYKIYTAGTDTWKL